MSIDKVTPRIFGFGKGKNNEPVNALILVFLIAFGGVMIGKLDDIANVVSMFYLAAYGFINLSFFLESWANPDFQPTFKVKRWIGLLGFLACFGVMFKLNAGAMFGAIVIIMGIYFWLKRKQIMLSTGDVWQSVWENIVTKGLRKLEETEKANNKWNPNIILFSGRSEHSPHLLKLGKTVAGRTGIVTNFDLIEQGENGNPLPKVSQTIHTSMLDKMGIFGRRVEVNNIYQGIENIASTFGFSGIDPNTIMMDWPKNITNQEEYSKMTQNLMHLDYNLLYLDYDERTKFGKRKTIDIWWRESDTNNAELMLNIARFINQSNDWNNCTTRVLFVNHNNVDNTLVKSKITSSLEALRLDAQIKIINNGVEQKSFYDIIKAESIATDLILLGLPSVEIEKQAEFIMKTNFLFETIGSTLLVRASNNFNEIELDFSKTENITVSDKSLALKPFPTSNVPEIVDLVHGFDHHLLQTAKLLADPGLSTISSYYYQLLNRIKVEFERTLLTIENRDDIDGITRGLQHFLGEMKKLSVEFKSNKLPPLEETFTGGINKFLEARRKYLEMATPKVKAKINGKNKTIFWKKTITQYSNTRLMLNTQQTLHEFGVEEFVLINKVFEEITDATTLYVEKMVLQNCDFSNELTTYSTTIMSKVDALINRNADIPKRMLKSMQNYERNLCISLLKELENSQKNSKQNLGKKDIELLESNVSKYATDWYRNQLLSHVQAETNLDLHLVGLSLVRIHDKLKHEVEATVIAPTERKLVVLNGIIDQIDVAYAAGNKQAAEGIDLQELESIVEEIPQSNLMDLLEDEEEGISSLSSRTAAITDLMSLESFNNLLKIQNEEVVLVSLNISTIQDYIIQTNYLSPLHQAMKEIEVNYRSSSEKLYYAANLIKHLIEDIATDDPSVNYREIIEETKNRVNSCQYANQENNKIFGQAFNSTIVSTLSDLNVRTILSTPDSFIHQAKPAIIKSKFELWIDEKKAAMKNRYRQVVNFIIQRKREIDTLKFDEKHIKYQNNIQRASNFLSALAIKDEVNDILPFYYKKLFTGSHLGNALNRQKATATAVSVKARIDQGISGGIMVIGESFSGKTYFTEHIANAVFTGKKHYIIPPHKQKFEKNDLHLAFQKTFNQSGTVESILNRIPLHSTIIFNDVEHWWMKNASGESVINYLAAIIDQFGSKHYFILNSNLYSFDVLRKTTAIEKSLLSTIVMSPLNREELQKVVLTRHHTAGADLAFDEEQFSAKKSINSIIAMIHELNNGNIGLSLNSWLRSIRIDNDKQLEVVKPSAVNFPAIEDPHWKLLLYHFILHGQLTNSHLEGLFGEQHEWLQPTLDELEKSGLISHQSGRIYRLEDTARGYVENWLQELKILNK